MSVDSVSSQPSQKSIPVIPNVVPVELREDFNHELIDNAESVNGSHLLRLECNTTCVVKMGRKCCQSLREWFLEVEMGLVWGIAGLSIIMFVFAAIWFIDPALLTLVLQFRQAKCLTQESAILVGISNCSWTSCRLGCTREVFKCWQVQVRFEFTPGSVPYRPPWASLSVFERGSLYQNEYQALPAPESTSLLAGESASSSSSATSSLSFDKQLARLYPNVRGCGYPPELDCDKFYKVYSAKDKEFDCWVSTLDTSIAMTQLDLDRAKEEVIYSLIPLFLFIVSILYAFCRLGVFTLCNPLRACPKAHERATLPSPDPEVPNLSDTPMSKKNKKSSTSKIEAVDFDKLFERGHAQSSLGGLNLVDSRLLGPDGVPKHNQPNSSLSYEEKVQSFLDEQTIGGSSQIPTVDKNELRSHYSTRIDPSPNRSRNTSKADIKSKPKFKIRSRDSSLSSRPGHSRPVSPLDFLKKLEGLAKDVEVEREYEENVWPAVNPNLPGVFDTRPPSQRDNRKDGTYTEPTQAHLDAFNSMNLSPRGQVPNQTERKLSNVTSSPEQVLSSLIIQPPLAQTNLPPPLSPSLRNNPNQPSNNFYPNTNQFALDVRAPSNSNQDSLDPNSSWAWAGNDQGPPVPPNRRPSSPWALNASNQQQPMAQPRRKSIGAQLTARDPSGMGQFLSAQDASHGQSRSASHSPNRFGSDNAGSHIPLNVPADRHLPARLLPDPLSKDMSNHPGMNPHDPSKNVENTELYKRLHDGLQTVENLILSSPFHQEQQITQRAKEQLQGADQSGQGGPQPMSSQVYSQNLGRAEFGTLRKRDQTQRAPGGASAVPSRDPSGERPRSRATSGTFAQSRPSALMSRQNSQDSNLSHLSDSHYPDLEFNTNSRPGSSMGTKPNHGVLHNNAPSSGESSRSNWATQRSGSSLNPTPMVLEKKKAILERIEKEKQLVKEAKSQMLILLLLGLCICILIYLQSEET